jgi:hypothetical protein
VEEIKGRMFPYFGQKSWEFCLISQLFFNIYMAMKNNILFCIYIFLIVHLFVFNKLAWSKRSYGITS